MNMKAADKITNQILELLSKGVNPWKKGWNTFGVSPFNPDTGHKYSGLNSLFLYIKAGDRLPAFTTANAKAGRYPKKGSKGVAILVPNLKKVEDAKTGEEKTKCFGFYHITVFSIYDIQNYDVASVEEKHKPVVYETTLDERAEELIKNMPNPPATIDFGGDRAYYMPSKDHVQMPKREQFENVNEYYSTYFHELAHSTGHFSRLDRKDGMENIRKGSEEYSKEELIAELTACFIGSEIGLKDDSSLKNSVAYLKGWIKPLQNDPTMIIHASRDALKATNYIMNVQSETERK